MLRGNVFLVETKAIWIICASVSSRKSGHERKKSILPWRLYTTRRRSRGYCAETHGHIARASALRRGYLLVVRAHVLVEDVLVDGAEEELRTARAREQNVGGSELR